MTDDDGVLPEEVAPVEEVVSSEEATSGWFAYTPFGGASAHASPRRYADYLSKEQPLGIQRLLVANRGEIARRVMRTAKQLDIQTIAVFSDVDRNAAHVRDADVAVGLGGNTSAESYLDVTKVLDAAKRSGADAIHPGYGFLSENADFAQAVTDAGLTWVGPTPDSIRAMALKVEAKRIAQRAGVPLVPGAEVDENETDAELIATGETVGYPLLVKASAGGGGKGMRVVPTAEGLLEAVETARREALNSFADSTVFFERYLTGARHVEVQVFGDGNGNVVHLFERECSIQRRHQKIVEESPSPGVSDATRAKMFEAATALTREIGYVGAGTVEFLVFGEGEDSAFDEQEFFFLEMNTRLQVEHPVTEGVTNLDLVEWQLRVADGQDLPLTQDDIHSFGHAIEVRLYAEDTTNGYIPSIGRAACLEVGGGGSDYVRTEMSVETGDDVSSFYDPMIGKIIAFGADRNGAIATLTRALRNGRIAGITTNRNQLVAILESDEFRDGATTTDFLELHPALSNTEIVPPDTRDELASVAAVSHVDFESESRPWSALVYPGWRNIAAVPQRCDLTVDGLGVDGCELTVVFAFDSAKFGRVEVRASAPESGWTGEVSGAKFRIADGQEWYAEWQIELDGISRKYGVDFFDRFVVVSNGSDCLTFQLLPRFPEVRADAVEGASAAPVPGTVVAVEVEVGTEVTEGQTLVVLEAMKMEHRITAQAAGTVDEVLVVVGDAVDAHQVLVVVNSGNSD